MKLKIGGAFVLVATLIAALGLGSGGGSSSCAYPSCFPSAATTGVTNAGALSTVTGDVSLNITSQVYENKLVNGCITVNANNVTIRNVKVNGHCDSGIFNNGTNLLVEDTEINCAGLAD